MTNVRKNSAKLTREDLKIAPESPTMELSKNPAVEPSDQTQAAKLVPLVYRVDEIAQLLAYGLVGFSQKIKGIVELLKEGNIAKGVKVIELEDNTIEIELFVIMQYGINIATVANNIIERVKYSVENVTGIKVSKIDVNVQGIRVK